MCVIFTYCFLLYRSSLYEVNNVTMFKCFKFIDDMMKQLNEADEMPMEDDAAMGGEESMEGVEDPAA